MNESAYGGVTDRAGLSQRLSEAVQNNEGLDLTRRQEMVALAAALLRGQRVESATWILDYMDDVSLTGEQYTGLDERVTVESDGSVSLAPQ